MQNDTGSCDGTEASRPFEAKNFAIRVFQKENSGDDSSKPMLEILKKGDSIEVTIYSWEGEVDIKAILKKDNTNVPGLLELLRVISNVQG